MSETNNICDIIIFGGHGDLALRKLMPALYHLSNDGYLNRQSRIISVSRKAVAQKDHLELIKSKLQEFLKENLFDAAVFEKFAAQLTYVKVDATDHDDYAELTELLNQIEGRDRVNYLSTSPSLYGNICKELDAWNLITPASRVVLEKPIGRDLESSRVINDEVAEYFEESAIYRIDHYLGKDTVQNILALRFSNALFMPLWNSRNIDHVQITVSETVGVEGRWSYYDDFGAMRDMVQNHLLQLLCLVAMEPPYNLNGDSVRDEKLKVLRSLRPITAGDIGQKTVRGQYVEGISGTKAVPGYLDEDGGNEKSNTETFAALRVDIDNWRWNRVPFYLRTGKRMRKRYSEIMIQFKEVPHSIFPKGGGCLESNKLIIRLQPDESITLSIMNKIPGLSEGMRLRGVDLDLNIPEKSVRTAEAYEHLLLDVIRDNPTLFMRRDEVEAAWIWADDILNAWQTQQTKIKPYPAGSDGPTASIALIERDNRSWQDD